MTHGHGHDYHDRYRGRDRDCDRDQKISVTQMSNCDIPVEWMFGTHLVERFFMLK